MLSFNRQLLFKILINCKSAELTGANSIQPGFRGKSHLTQNRRWEKWISVCLSGKYLYVASLLDPRASPKGYDYIHQQAILMQLECHILNS